MIFEIDKKPVEGWDVNLNKHSAQMSDGGSNTYYFDVYAAAGISDADLKAALIEGAKDALDYHDDPYSETDTFIARGYQS